MINVITGRAPAVASRKTARRLVRGLAALSVVAACVGVILLSEIGETHAAGAPHGLTLRAAPVTPAATGARGKIAFSRSNNRFGSSDIYVMEPHGTMATVLTSGDGLNEEPAWSPDGSKIAFTSTRDGNYEVYVMNADGTGQTNLTRSAAVETSPAWSPDGARIAFVSQGWPSSGGQTIRVISPEGAGERVVAVPPNQTTGPSWSPDGTEVVYDAANYAIFRIEVDGCRALAELLNTSRRDRHPAWQTSAVLPAPAPAATPCPAPPPAATPAPRPADRVLFTSLRDGNPEIYVMNGDGTGQTNLTNNPAVDASPVWSPDGTRIAFTSNRPGPSNTTGRSNIYVMNADGSGVRQVTNNGREGSITGIVYDPAWSPDGTKLVYVSSFMGELSSLVVINVEGEAATTFISTVEAADPAWSPDGTRIAYVGREGVDNPEDPTNAWHLYVVNADGSGKTRISSIVSPFTSFPYPPQASGPAWSPDGKRLVFVGNLGNDELYTVGATGGLAVPLTEHPAQDLMPVWLPDGSGIAFTSYRDAQQRDIYLMNADGGPPARLTSHPADDFDPDWRSAQPPPRYPAPESTIQFSQSSFRIRESGPYGDTITVTRLGDLSREATVDFATRELCPPNVACDGAARDRSDFVRAEGTLRFAPGEAAKTIDITVIDDAHIEIDEFFHITLSNVVGATLGAQSEAGVTITDNEDRGQPAQNPIDTPHFLVRMHYLDFLGREPEPEGLQAWVDVLGRCPNPFNTDRASPSAACDRIQVSSSFFRAPEFEFKGYYVLLFYRVSLGRSPTYNEFLRDLRAISGQTAEEVIAKKAAFASAWTERAEFQARYGDRVSAEGFVDRLLQVAGLTLGGEVTRDTLVADLRAGRKTQAEVVRAVAEHPAARAKEFNGAFVTMQYFGYLKRDPEEAGYSAWLNYLNANPADFRTMIHGFLNSVEYRSRFGGP